MSELYLFSQDEKLISILSEDTGLLSAYYRMEVNNVPAEPFSFTIESDHDNVKHVKEENKVVFKDHEGDWRMMVIRELDDIDTLDGPETTATCEPVFLAELTDHIVVDRRFIDSTADKALNAALEGTRWIGEVEISLGLSSTNFYYLTSIEAIWKTKNTWGGEVKDVVVFDEETNEIVACKIKLIQRFGADIGQRFEIDHNTTEIGRTILSYPKTALYGRGASLQTENDGYTRYIDFEDVEWSIVNGDPVDKPLGQKWIGDPNLLTQLGYENGTKHRFGIYSNQDYDDPSELLQATWNYLQDSASQIAINYRLSVDLFNETVSLGDTAQAIDRRFARPVEIQTRIIAMEYDILDVEETMVIEMGQFLELDDDRIGELEETIDRDRGKWDHPIINNENFPNTKPSTPVNVSATGGFQTIQLHWDYDSHIYINSYEVYGSQVMDFIPDSQHLLYRGRVSGFNHEVATDQVWYYRIRAVNTQGTPGEFSAQVSASTVRVISDDILFGESIAAELRKLNTIADGAVTFEQLSQQAKELIQQDAKQYTDSEVSSTKNELLTDIANKADLTYVDGQLLSKADANSVYTITQLDNKFDNVVSVTKYQTDINGIVTNLESHETRIYQNELGLGSKVDATYVQSAISDIEIGGRNYFVIKDALEDTLLAWASGNPLPSTGALTSGFMPVELNATYYVSPVRTDQLFYYDINKVHISDYGNMSGGTTIQIPNDERIAFMRIVFRNNFLDGRTKEEVEVKVEKGNKATDWTPAPEDVQAQIDDNALVISNHTTLIEQNELAITQRATTTEVNELTGRMSIAEGSITTMSNQIDLKVDVDGIVSSLNLSQEGIRIKASLIELDGTTLISSGIIQNAHIANGAITNAKIGTLAVSAGQIQNAAITNAKIADLAVDSAKIADAAITNAKIANASIDDAKISSLSADKINAGILSAIDIEGVNITGSRFVSNSASQDRQLFIDSSRIHVANHDTSTEVPDAFVDISGDKFLSYKLGFELRDAGMVFQASNGLYRGDIASGTNEYGASTLFVKGDNELNLFASSRVKIESLIDARNGMTITGHPRNSYNGISSSTSNGGHLMLDSNGSGHLYLNYTDDGDVYMCNGGGDVNLADGSGSVGIGTRSPAYRLDVRGNGRFTSSLTAQSISVGSSGINSSGYVVTNAVDHNGSGTHLYIRPGSTGEVRTTGIGSTSYYEAIRTAGVITGYTNLYLGAPSEVRAMNGNRQGWGSYIPVRASSFPTSSSIKYKDNIENFSDYDAYRILDSTDVVTYHLKTNLEIGIYDKAKIGVLSEMIPREIRDEDGVDTYSMVSVLWKIAKVQKSKITQLEQRISDLEMVV